MALSLTSKRFAIVDIPEVIQFKASFRYNFFSKDESINDSGIISPDFIEKRASADFDRQFIDSVNFNRFTPRYISLTWKPVPYGNRGDLVNKISIAKNLQKIHDEQTFTTEDYTNVVFQDNSADDKISYFIQQIIDEASKNPDSNDQSPLDIAKYLNKITTSNINGDFLAEFLNKYRASGVTFLDEEGKASLKNEVSEKLSNIHIRTQLNNKFIGDSLRTTLKNPINIFNNQTLNLHAHAKLTQQRSSVKQPGTLISGKDYDFEILDIIDYKIVDPSSFNSIIQVVGYMIEKTEYTDSGAVKKQPIIIESATASSTVDLKVKYGSTYGYTIRSVALVEITAEDDETNSIIAITFLVSSRKSPMMVVKCEEKVAPPPVSDFNIEWDYYKKAARLSWSFPPNSQRDIKYFQIFRRKTIEEPFELIKMYDFNDSLTSVSLMETPDSVLFEKISSPIGYYIDYEFNKESKFIYAICAIDAHGFSSNYSIQFECSFDVFKNKLIKKLISLSGAPKQYPNFFLQRDTFVDSIRTSGKSKLKIVFSPEYLKVIDREKNDLKLLKTDQNSSYKLQMINIDLQKQETIDISLRDRRSTTKKQ